MVHESTNTRAETTTLELVSTQPDCEPMRTMLHGSVNVRSSGDSSDGCENDTTGGRAFEYAIGPSRPVCGYLTRINEAAPKWPDGLSEVLKRIVEMGAEPPVGSSTSSSSGVICD
jgi:hypothetical protein